ncbi:MAG: hypothetical protein WBC88_00465 [Candidatus Zixiibacteriota bacterium]
MRSKSSFLVVLAVFVCLSSTAAAQELSVKRHWFTGTYKYSTDGVNYHEFGKGWSSLKGVVEENQEALGLVNSARSLNIISQICGGAGGALLGWNLGTELGGREAEPSLWVAGGVLFVTGLTMDIVGNSKVHKAAKVYNSAGTKGPHGSGKGKGFQIALSPRSIKAVYVFF